MPLPTDSAAWLRTRLVKVRLLPGVPLSPWLNWIEHRPPKAAIAGSTPAGDAIGVSSNGKTADFDSANGGSIPPAPTTFSFEGDAFGTSEAATIRVASAHFLEEPLSETRTGL